MYFNCILFYQNNKNSNYLVVFSFIFLLCLQKTVAFQYSWLDEMFREMATFVFFVLTGYKFRPASANPYFTAKDTDDIEAEV